MQKAVLCFSHLWMQVLIYISWRDERLSWSGCVDTGHAQTSCMTTHDLISYMRLFGHTCRIGDRLVCRTRSLYAMVLLPSVHLSVCLLACLSALH